jgi:glycosyltransferase involved in cell wall biosynthesis
MHADLEFDPGVTFLNLRGRDTRDASAFRETLKLSTYYVRLLHYVITAGSGVLYDVSIGRPFLRCLLMYSALRLARVKVIYTAHNVVPHDGDTALNRAVHFVIYRVLTTAIVVHGEALKSRLIREFGVAAETITVVPIGTYHPPNDPSLTKAAARETLGIPADARVALVFGLQRPYKGTHFVLETLTSQPIEGLYVLIRGNATCLKYRQRLANLIECLPPACRVDANLEAVPAGAVEALFKASDVVLLPYFEGSQSAVKFLAYAYGRPVLCSDLDSLAEYVQAGKTGETFRPGDSESFGETLRGMLAGIERYDENSIRRIAYAEYSFDAAMVEIEAIYSRFERAGSSGLATQENAT